MQRFGGRIVHPQHWTADIDYADRRVVVIGSGATAVTLVPAKIWIARGRWQEHLKRGGEDYHARARELESLHAEHPAVGAHIAAVANYALAELLERCRVQKLTRHQHILMRPGAVIAQVDGLATLARRAQRAATKQLEPSASKRLRDEPLAALSRVNARGAERTIATEAVRLVAGADGGELDGLPRTAPRSLFHPSRSGRVARPSAEGRRRGSCRARTSLTY